MARDISAMTVSIGGNHQVFAVKIEFEEAPQSSIEVYIQRDMSQRMQSAFASAMNNMFTIIDQAMESAEKIEPGQLLLLDLTDRKEPE
jgi:chemotaxis response regulator CheB